MIKRKQQLSNKIQTRANTTTPNKRQRRTNSQQWMPELDSFSSDENICHCSECKQNNHEYGIMPESNFKSKYEANKNIREHIIKGRQHKRKPKREYFPQSEAQQFLEKNGLIEFWPVFEENKILSTEDLSLLGIDDLNDLGVPCTKHSVFLKDANNDKNISRSTPFKEIHNYSPRITLSPSPIKELNTSIGSPTRQTPTKQKSPFRNSKSPFRNENHSPYEKKYAQRAEINAEVDDFLATMTQIKQKRPPTRTLSAAPKTQPLQNPPATDTRNQRAPINSRIVRSPVGRIVPSSANSRIMRSSGNPRTPEPQKSPQGLTRPSIQLQKIQRPSPSPVQDPQVRHSTPVSSATMPLGELGSMLSQISQRQEEMMAAIERNKAMIQEYSRDPSRVSTPTHGNTMQLDRTPYSSKVLRLDLSKIKK